MDKVLENEEEIEDLKEFYEMYRELRWTGEIKAKYKNIVKFAFVVFILGSLLIFLELYSISILVMLLSSILALFLRNLDRSADTRFLEKYLSSLSEKQIVFLDIIIEKDRMSFNLNKKKFKALYPKIVKENNLDKEKIIMYKKLYKNNDKFNKVILDYK